MKIAGRKPQIALLQSLLAKPRSEFLAVYGRRRIGKTFLIREVFDRRIAFECSGLHQKSFAHQLENFWTALAETYPAIKSEARPKSWLEAFSLLKKCLNDLPASDEKKVIFLDEISWFDTPRAGFLAALDNFWNQWCTKRSDIILVICGSAASWIIQKVANDRGGLHNRVTQHLQLMPFDLAEMRDFLELEGIRWAPRDVLLFYMCVGGVPFYGTGLEAGMSVPQALDRLFFGDGARLKNEFRNLYAALFKNSALHEKIVAALASKNKGLSRTEIVAATGLESGGGLSVALEELIACGFVRTVFPIDKNSEGALFRLIDEFTLFYFQFLQPRGPKNSWLQVSATAAFRVWSGFAFEGVCLKHTAQIKRALGISGIISNDFSWQWKGDAQTQGAQIDLLIDRADNCINLLEIKFHVAEFEMTKAQADQLAEKARIFKARTRTRKSVFITLLTAAGARRNEHFLSVVTNALELDALFLER